MSRSLLSGRRLQSTLPMKGATRRYSHSNRYRLYFNPRSQWRERRSFVSARIQIPNFNPRSQWRERQWSLPNSTSAPLLQSTLPMKGATAEQLKTLTESSTSIHAPNEGSDLPLLPWVFADLHFNPRSQWRERLLPAFIILLKVWLQSTLPMKGATSATTCSGISLTVLQSTLPMKGATNSYSFIWLWKRYFNPRSQWRERLVF